MNASKKALQLITGDAILMRARRKQNGLSHALYAWVTDARNAPEKAISGWRNARTGILRIHLKCYPDSLPHSVGVRKNLSYHYLAAYATRRPSLLKHVDSWANMWRLIARRTDWRLRNDKRGS